MSNVANPTIKTETEREFRQRQSYPTDINKGVSYARKQMVNTAQGIANETAYGSAMVKNLDTNIIGKGLVPMASPQNDFLNWTPEETKTFIDQVQRVVGMIFSSRKFDYYGKQNFVSLQHIAYKIIATSGDTLLHLTYSGKKGRRRPSVQVINGKSVRNDGVSMDTKKIAGGVEVDDKGREIAYWIAETDDNLNDTYKSKRFNKYNQNTGDEDFLLISLDSIEANQRRGISVFSACVGTIVGLEEFNKNSLTSSVVQTLFSLFITHAKVPEETERASDAFRQLSQMRNQGTKRDVNGNAPVVLEAGIVTDLEDGADVKVVSPDIKGADYETFNRNQLTIAAASAGTSYESVTNTHNSSYSASKASIASNEKRWEIIREEFAEKFCRPIYEFVVDWGIKKGLITAPNYPMKTTNRLSFEEEMIKEATLAVSWIGPNPIQLDPVKEANAWILKIQYGLCTREEAIRALSGKESLEIFEALAREKEKLQELGLWEDVQGTSLGQTDEVADGDTDDGDTDEEEIDEEEKEEEDETSNS